MKSTGVTLMVGTVMLASAAGPAKAKSENGLLGIKLYDSGTRVISVYGTPDQIDAVNIGGGSVGGGGGFAGGAGPGGPPGMGAGPAGAPAGVSGGKGKNRPGASSAGGFRNSPFDFADSMLQRGMGMPPSGFPGAPGGGGSAGAGAPAGMPGPGSFGGPGGPGAGSAPSGNGGAAENASYTRWIYKRNGSQYGFVFDKFNHVVQIEAIGIQNAKVKTSRGIGFGSTFAQIIKTYQAPDGYEISGDNVLVKYLTKSKVAFRLSRLGEKQPQVVTGVVVAAAKG